jgi:hypothetical protein
MGMTRYLGAASVGRAGKGGVGTSPVELGRWTLVAADQVESIVGITNLMTSAVLHWTHLPDSVPGMYEIWMVQAC